VRAEEMANLTDEEFAAFFKSQWPRLVAALATVVPRGEDPSDVAQEAMTRAYADWTRVQAHPRPDAWLFLTAYRLAVSARRRKRVRGRYKNVGMPQPTSDPASLSMLELALVSLPSRQRAAILLRHVYGLYTRETARALRCREGTVKSLLSKAKAGLSANFEEDHTEPQEGIVR
jgi:RNA polymerase sigma-70 factor (ECF subfamily)